MVANPSKPSPAPARRPLARLLLVPVVGLLLAGVLANVGFGIWLAARRGGEQVNRRQRQVVAALDASRVGLSPPLLETLHQLTGDHFVVWDGPALSLTRQANPPRFATLPAAVEAFADGPAGPLPAETTTIEGLADLGAARIDGRSYRLGLVETRAGRPQTVLILSPTGDASRVVFEATWPVLAVAVGTLGLLVPLGIHVAGRIAGRIGRVERLVTRIAEGDFGRTLGETGEDADELARLVASVNAMSQALAELRRTLVAGERERLLGQLAAGFAHELRNGITGARLAIDLHRSRCTRARPAGNDESLTVAARQLEVMEEEVRGLLAVGKPDERAPTELPLDPLLGEVEDLVGPRAEHADVAIDFGSAAGSVVRGRRESLRAAVVNLVVNAIEAARRGAIEAAAGGATAPRGEVRITIEQAADGGLAIAVEDSGAGPPAELEATLFEPFVSGRPEGIGIGLAVAAAVAAEHGGRVDHSRVADSTRFAIILPASVVIRGLEEVAS